MSIPKVIHYCWFGRGEMPKLAEKCIKSWKKYCPDYEIICWNEDNFDLSQNRYSHGAVYLGGHDVRLDAPLLFLVNPPEGRHPYRFHQRLKFLRRKRL